MFGSICFDSPVTHQVDLRASVGLEGYRRNIGDEIGILAYSFIARRIIVDG